MRAVLCSTDTQNLNPSNSAGFTGLKIGGFGVPGLHSLVSTAQKIVPSSGHRAWNTNRKSHRFAAIVVCLTSDIFIDRFDVG